MTRSVPEATLLTVAETVKGIGFPIHAKERITYLRISATDSDWSAGDGRARPGSRRGGRRPAGPRLRPAHACGRSARSHPAAPAGVEAHRASSPPPPRRPGRGVGDRHRRRRPADRAGAALHPVPTDRRRPRHDHQPWIGNGVVDLLEHPEQLGLLRHDPDRMPAAVEELIRYSAPVPHATFRVTTEAVELEGVRIPAGKQVLVCLGAANRDPSVIDAPTVLDIGREPRAPPWVRARHPLLPGRPPGPAGRPNRLERAVQTISAAPSGGQAE